MSLERSLDYLVPARIRARGRRYFELGAVRLLHGTHDEVAARVRGGALYDVFLRWDGTTLEALCSCPYYGRELTACKHVWATVLAAAAHGHLGAVRGRRDIEILTAPAEMLDELDSEFDDELNGESDGDLDPAAHVDGERRGERRSARGLSKAPAPGWKELLAMLDATQREAAPPVGAAAWVPGTEILYSIDVPQTLARSRLALGLFTRARKRDGSWSRPQPARINPGHLATLPDPADREILSILQGGQDATYWYAYAHDRLSASVQLSPVLGEVLVPLLCRTGRCVLSSGGAPAAEPRALGWDDGPPWELWLEARKDDAHRQYVLRGGLRRGQERMDLAEPVCLLAGGFVFASERVARLEDHGAFTWIVLLRQRGEIRVPVGERQALHAELLRAPALPRLDLPPELRVEELRETPRPRLRLRPDETARSAPGRLRAELSFDYGGCVLAEDDPAHTACDEARGRRILRDPEAERSAAERLVALGCRHIRSYLEHQPVRQLTARHVPHVVRTLLEDGWHVEAEGKVYRRPGASSLRVISGIDWFDLEGSVAYGDQSASLPALLAALRRGDNLVRLGDGSFGMLPEEWLRKCGPIGALGAPAGDAVRFRPAQVGLLDALLAAMPEATWDDRFGAAREELARFGGVAAADPPPSFAGTLRSYQRDGLGWILFLERFRFGGCLADDMGLGKTVQALALLEARRTRRIAGHRDDPRPSLVVAPRSLVFNWKAEAARFAPELRVVDHTGPGRSRAASGLGDVDLVLTTYGTLRRDAALLRDVRFGWVILDEAQAIKNAGSASAKAARLLHAEQRLALSGTPIENHLGELWSLFEFLNPGMLGSASVFRVLSGGASRTLDADDRALLARALRPFILRRTKEQVATELPPRTEQTLVAELDRPQRRLYEQLRDHYRRALRERIERQGLARAKIHVLEALLRLRQAACHPGLIEPARAGEPSAKLDALLPTLDEVLAEHHKVLVFSQFTRFLAIVRSRLDGAGIAYEYLDGRTRKRAARVERFQHDPDCRLFLISLKAGGLGLNLTAADYVFLLDPWWNPAVEAQAIDRTHRIGQTRQVFAYRLIARDTVEEKILALQEQKRGLAQAILTDENSLIRTLSREDLELLLS